MPEALKDNAKRWGWWWQRQGLDGSLQGASPATVLERSGWARSVAGAGPYLTLFARSGATREAIDRAVANSEIHELPTARGCTYVLPASDYAVGLRVGEPFADSHMRVARSLGVTDAEVETLSQAVLKAVAKKPLEPNEIRAATGELSRNLGDAGKKKGVTTTLPLAFGLLQARGDIRRVPVNGRLDQQRYAYVRWSPNPLSGFKGSLQESQVELGRRFFRWVGPAKVSEFQGFAGLGVKAVKDVVALLDLVPCAPGSDRLLLKEDALEYLSFTPPKKAQYALVSSLDTLIIARRDVPSLLDPQDLEREVQGERAMLKIGAIADLPSHAILDRGRLIGLWEFDTEAGSIAWTTFGIKDKALDAAVLNTEAFVRDQLGDARSFSLDSPKSRVARVEWLRGMQKRHG